MRPDAKRSAAVGRRNTSPTRRDNASIKPHPAWVILAVCFATLLTVAATRALPGVVLVSLEHELGWSREVIVLAASVNMLMLGWSGPLLGSAIDKHGPRRVTLVCLAWVGLGAFATVWVQESWQMVLIWGVVVGSASGGPSMVVGSVLVHRWFVARRGLALGVLGAAMSAGQLVFTPLLMYLNLVYGWRAALLCIATVIGGMVLPVALALLRNDPSDIGLRPYGGENLPKPVPLSADRATLRTVMRNRNFRLLALSFAICGLTTSGLVQTHLIAYGVEQGFQETTMAMSLGVMGAADILGTVASGWICDRYGRKVPLALYYLLRGVSLLVLPCVESGGELLMFSLMYGLNWLSTVPATSALAADLFGKRHVGTVFGWIFFAHQVGAAVAAYGAGYLHTLYGGGYDLAFGLAGLLALIGAASVLCIECDNKV